MATPQLVPTQIPFPPQIPYHRQAFPVRGTEKPGQTAHYRNAIWGLVDENTPNVLSTLDAIFAQGLAMSRDKDFLGHRSILPSGKHAPYYEWISYAQADERRRHIGSALHTMFKNGTLKTDNPLYENVGIWAPNRPEWQLVDIALQSYNKVGVSLYDTLGKDSVEYIINHAALSIIFSSKEHIPALLKLGPAKLPTLKYVVSFDNLSEEASTALKEWGSTVGIEVIQLAELEAFGKANPVEPIPAFPETVASICYTSGTTNMPKGVVLLHKTLALSIQSYFYGRDYPDQGTVFSYLPLAHIYERMVELGAVATGSRIGYFTGDPLRLLEDVQILKPHTFPSVPRILNRIYQAAMLAKSAPGLKGLLFRQALATKLANLDATNTIEHKFWDKIVFKKIRAVLGGEVLMVGSGSAPISEEVLKFLKVALVCDVVEGYGLTETAACCSRTLKGDPNGVGTVGPPAPVNEVKLIDVPEMGYTAQDKPFPRGELCIRGTVVFSHYYKDENTTRQALDPERWFRTGDVAWIDDAGRIKIIDRVKNIMKLSQGEYVALEKVENVYSGVPFLAQVFVHGDGTQSYLVGVVVPDLVAFSTLVSEVWGRKVDLGPEAGEEGLRTAEAAINDEAVKAKVLEVMTAQAKKGGLNGYETVKRIHISLSLFSVDDGTLTPTMKLKRKDAYNKYKTEIDALYALGEPQGGSGGAGSVKL